jgi:hypothetical protein
VSDLIVDRSRIVARQDCPRMRYWQYDAYGTGISPETTGIALSTGTALHEVIAEFVKTGNMEVALLKNTLEDTDQRALVEGMARGWQLVRWPQLNAEYEVMLDYVETEHLVTLFEDKFDCVKQSIRFDMPLRHRETGQVVILDLKTLSYPSQHWVAKWEHDLQTQLYSRAARQMFGPNCGGVLYDGLVKGSLRVESSSTSPFSGQRIQQSPYCYAYSDGTDYSSSYVGRKGWKKVRVYDHMPMSRWVQQLYMMGVLEEQFVSLPPINPPVTEQESLARQAGQQEVAYALHLVTVNENPELIDSLIPQHTGRCYKYGDDYGCAYRGFCFTRGADPLADGGFIVRVPHHTHG